jgi:hypothetical protein
LALWATLLIKLIYFANFCEIVQYTYSFSKISETFIYDYFTEIEEQGSHVSIITHRCHNRQDRSFEPVNVVGWPGRWHPVRLFNRIRLHNSKKPYVASFSLQVRARLRPVVANIDPDVIHAHFGPQGVIMHPVAHGLEIPLVVHFHGYDVSFLLPDAFWEEQYKALFDSASALIPIFRTPYVG